MGPRGFQDAETRGAACEARLPEVCGHEAEEEVITNLITAKCEETGEGSSA